MFNRGMVCGTGDLDWMNENRPENAKERARILNDEWLGDGESRLFTDNSADPRSNGSVQASDIEDTVKRYKSIRGSIVGSTGQPTDFLNPGQPAADPNETIHEAVNDTEWWLK